MLLICKSPLYLNSKDTGTMLAGVVAFSLLSIFLVKRSYMRSVMYGNLIRLIVNIVLCGISFQLLMNAQQLTDSAYAKVDWTENL